MAFTSLKFILFFIPACTVLYRAARLAGRRAGDLFLLAASLFFYGFAGLDCLIVFGLSAGVTWLCHLLSTGAGDEARRRAFCGAGVAFNLALLGVFKYTGFVLENAGLLLRRPMPELSLFLPLGISFYAFSQISFLVDTFRENRRADALSFLVFAAYFPKVTQGPIASYHWWEGAKAEAEGRAGYDWERAACGIILFAAGLAKKVLLADVFGRAVDFGFANLILLTRGDMLLVMVAYSFQIYFDFSGYSDMASGVSLLLGIDLPVNFDSPYRADSVTDFWRRWHMSLTTFFREYVYFPLGGSRRGRARTCLNILAVFLLSGLWHGANWTFVVWGLVHGLLQVTERLLGGLFRKIPALLRRIWTFAAVTVLWTLFRCPTLGDFERVRWHVVVDPYWILNEQILDAFRIPGLRFAVQALHIPVPDRAFALAGVFAYLGAGAVLSMAVPNLQKNRPPLTRGWLLLALVLLMAGILSLGGVSTFLYTSF